MYLSTISFTSVVKRYLQKTPQNKRMELCALYLELLWGDDQLEKQVFYTSSIQHCKIFACLLFLMWIMTIKLRDCLALGVLGGLMFSWSIQSSGSNSFSWSETQECVNLFDNQMSSTWWEDVLEWVWWCVFYARFCIFPVES